MTGKLSNRFRPFRVPKIIWYSDLSCMFCSESASQLSPASASTTTSKPESTSIAPTSTSRDVCADSTLPKPKLSGRCDFCLSRSVCLLASRCCVLESWTFFAGEFVSLHCLSRRALLLVTNYIACTSVILFARVRKILTTLWVNGPVGLQQGSSACPLEGLYCSRRI